MPSATTSGDLGAALQPGVGVPTGGIPIDGIAVAPVVGRWAAAYCDACGASRSMLISGVEIAACDQIGQSVLN